MLLYTYIDSCHNRAGLLLRVHSLFCGCFSMSSLLQRIFNAVGRFIYNQAKLPNGPREAAGNRY
jgi:hypothetical protein